MSQQRRIVAVSAMLVFAMGSLARIQKGEDQFDVDAARFYIGVGLAFTFISVFTDLGSPLGAGFAVLVLLAAFFNQGDELLKFLTDRAEKPKKKEKARLRTPRGRKNQRNLVDRVTSFGKDLAF